MSHFGDLTFFTANCQTVQALECIPGDPGHVLGSHRTSRSCFTHMCKNVTASTIGSLSQHVRINRPHAGDTGHKRLMLTMGGQTFLFPSQTQRASQPLGSSRARILRERIPRVRSPVPGESTPSSFHNFFSKLKSQCLVSTYNFKRPITATNCFGKICVNCPPSRNKTWTSN